MRSEAEIRREVEKRFHRWVFLLLNGGLWLVVGAGLYFYSRYQGVPAGWLDSVILFLMLWGLLVGLHLFRTFYVESREWLVSRAIAREAIARERRYYDIGDTYAKPKRRETLPRLSDDEIIEDESIEDTLVDFPDSADDESIAKVKHGR